MAKNVKITEDGTTKIIENATRIRTSLDGGGTCDWIPKDDVPLQELTVTEDGVYRPEEGYYGFSTVTANGVGNVVEGDLIEKTVTKNGTYNITDESGSPYGYSKIIVNVDTSEDDSGSGGGGGSPVVGKDEDGNDNMVEVDDDGNIVMTALPTEIKVIIPPTKLEYNRYEEIDYGGISVYAYISKMIHWLGTTTTAISEGSTNNTVSIGENSVTASIGDGVLYAPDRTGTNDIQLVWDGIKWVKPGDYSAEKAIWKSEEYETGKMPFDELIFPMKKANYSDMSAKKTYKRHPSIPYNICVDNAFGITSSYENASAVGVYEDKDNLVSGVKTGNISTKKMSIASFIERETPDRALLIIASDNPTEQINITATETYCFWGGYTGIGYNIGYRETNETVNGTWSGEIRDRLHDLIGGGIYHVHWVYTSLIDNSVTIRDDYGVGGVSTFVFSNAYSASSYTYMGKTVYYHAIYVYQDNQNYAQNTSFSINNNYDLSDIDISSAMAAWIIVYGDDADSDTIPISIPVQWKRPGDGKILETTFTAWMTDESGDNNTSGSTTPGSQNIDVPQ